MFIEHVSTCPAWCDPRTHHVHGRGDHEHREEGLTFKPLVADTTLTVRLVQFEEIGVPNSASDVMVHMSVTDAGWELPITTGTELNPSDARMLAAVLVSAAERAEAVQYRSRISGGAR